GFLLSLSQTEKSLYVATKKSSVALPLLAKSYQRWKVVSRRVKKQLKKADAADLETLHRLRIRYKELRYLIELWIEADIPLSVDKKNLKEWQEILGEITDLRIMADIIRKIGLSPVIHLEFMLQAQKEAQKFLECREKFAQFLAEIEQQVEWYFNGKLP